MPRRCLRGAQDSWSWQNKLVHVAAANPHHRRAAGLTFQRDQTKRFLHARMNKEIGRSIIRGELSGVGAILNPGDVFPAAAGLELSKLFRCGPSPMIKR